MKLFLEKLSCDGKIQPAKGSDQQDEDENCKDVPSNVRWMLIRQFISLSQRDLICPLENRSEETANEIEKSASDSADATSLFNVSQRLTRLCRRKMRMSGLCKVEMSAFMVGEGPMETERIALSQRERDRLRVLQDVQQGHITRRTDRTRIVVCSRVIALAVRPATRAVGPVLVGSRRFAPFP